MKILLIILLVGSMYYQGSTEDRNRSQRWQEREDNPDGLYSSSYLNGGSSIYN